MARILLAEDDTTIQFDLLVADVVMPSLDGFQLAARARVTHPELQVMFITGFAAVTLRAREQELRGSKVLSKPFHLRELVEQVEDVLRQPAAI
jgi:two-component system cell cycle response regulator CpdR